MNRYEWIWEGQTQKGSCQWQTKEGTVIHGTAWDSGIENDIIDKTKATYYATIVAEFINQCQKQGITATLSSVDVQCEIVKDPLQSSCYYGGAEHAFEFCNYNQLFIVKVKGTVVFESTQDLAGSPIAPALLWVLAKCIALIIIALGVSYGIYEFLRNLTLNQTTSTITKTTTNPVTGETTTTTEQITTQQPSITAWGGIIALAIVGIGLLVVLPSLLERKGKRA